MNSWVYSGVFAVVLSAVALGCAAPAPLEYDASGYPVGYAVPPHERFGVCSESWHPSCHAHSRHYRDAHGDRKAYRWEHSHRHHSSPSPAREPLAEVQSVSEGPPSQAAASLAEVTTSDPVPVALGWAAISRIVGIEDRGETIQITAKGPIDSFDSFTLEDPRRIVIDFWGAQSGVQAVNRGSAEGPVSQIRIRERPGKVRVVLDLRAEVRSHRYAQAAAKMSGAAG